MGLAWTQAMISDALSVGHSPRLLLPGTLTLWDTRLMAEHVWRWDPLPAPHWGEVYPSQGSTARVGLAPLEHSAFGGC